MSRSQLYFSGHDDGVIELLVLVGARRSEQNGLKQRSADSIAGISGNVSTGAIMMTHALMKAPLGPIPLTSGRACEW